MWNLIDFDILSSEAVWTPALMQRAQIILSSLHISSVNNVIVNNYFKHAKNANSLNLKNCASFMKAREKKLMH